MTKPTAILKFVMIATATIAGIIYLDGQNFETRMLLGIYALIVYLAYFANQRIDQLAKDKFYLCTFEKQIIAADSDDELARFTVSYKLPFAPFIGLEVMGDAMPSETNEIPDDSYADSGDFYTGKVISATWKYNKFICIVEPHKMSRENIFEKVVMWYSEDAWKLSSYHYQIKKQMLDYIDNKLLELQNEQGDKIEDERWELERAKKKLEQE